MTENRSGAAERNHRSHHDTAGVQAVDWVEGALSLLDQRKLPRRVERLRCTNVQAVAGAIGDMVVRGAPAIGVSAAYGVVLAARDRYRMSPGTWKRDIDSDLALLARARPTAVNLAWALARMRACIDGVTGDPQCALLAEARSIHDEDIAANRRMGELGATLIAEPCEVLTHCNAGALATGGYGTALGVIRTAFRDGKVRHVYADETRPWMQGARLTAWELVQDRIPVSLIADAAAAYILAQGEVGWVIVGADRVAANGDVANKIGTYALAVSARFHGVGFMVVAPTSTIDLDCANGRCIPIESRSAEELLNVGGQRLAASGANACNPVFDVTPAALVDALVTEKGVVMAPDEDKIGRLMGRPSGSDG